MIYRQEMYESEGHLLKVLTEVRTPNVQITTLSDAMLQATYAPPILTFHGQAQLEISRGRQAELITFWFPIADASTIPQAFERYEACAKVAAQAKIKALEEAALKQALASPQSPIQLPQNGRFKR